VVRLLVVQTQEETTVQIQYLTQLLLLVAVVVVRRLFLPQVVKMVVRAVAAQIMPLAARQHRDKATLAARQMQVLLHRVAAVVQVLLAQMEHQARLALAGLAQHHLLVVQALPMLVAVVAAHQATKREE
jgi:hypothetical protein